MTMVKAKEGERFESVMRRFRKAVERAGVMADLRKHEFYEKPSVQRKRKQAAARKRSAREASAAARGRSPEH
jgi:small subunit ribosomal protein S21